MNPRRIYGLEAAKAGDMGDVHGEILGPCPSCAGELHLTRVENPNTGRVERALMHSVPFCTYYLVTDPATVVRAAERANAPKED